MDAGDMLDDGISTLFLRQILDGGAGLHPSVTCRVDAVISATV